MEKQSKSSLRQYHGDGAVDKTTVVTPRLRASSRQYSQMQTIVQKLFDVSPSERVMGVYDCASLSGRISLAPRMGKMYVTKDHICFFSNFLGNEQKFAFNINGVRAMELGTKMVYDTISFDVKTDEERKTYMFASFSSEKRQECYDLCSKLIPERNNDDDDLLEGFIDDDDVVEKAEGGVNVDSKIVTRKIPIRKKGMFLKPIPEKNDRKTDRSHMHTNAHSLSLKWIRHFEDEMDTVATFSLDTSLDETFKILLADNARFSCIYLSSHTPGGGESSHKLTSWKRLTSSERNEDGSPTSRESGTSPSFDQAHYSHKRKFEFTKKLNHVIGPKEAKVYQRHRYGFFKSSAHGAPCVAFESIVTTPDVPYGTYFCVRLKYLLLSEGESRTKTQVAVSVDMLKNTMWGGKIKSETLKATKASWASWKKRILSNVGKRSRARMNSSPTKEMEKQEKPHVLKKSCCGAFNKMEEMFDTGVTPSEGILRFGLFGCILLLVYYAMQFLGFSEDNLLYQYAGTVLDAITTQNVMLGSTLIMLYLLASILHHFRRARQQLRDMQREQVIQNRLLSRMLMTIRDS